MKHSSVSMLLFAVYMTCLAIAFVFFPNPVITLLGFAPVTDVWIRVFGVVLGIMAFYYCMAVREEATNFYRWTVYGRLALLPVFGAFVGLGLGPPVMLGFGAFDSGCAMWTWLTLRRERT
jgi:hypothetical protein